MLQCNGRNAEYSDILFILIVLYFVTNRKGLILKWLKLDVMKTALDTSMKCWQSTSAALCAACQAAGDDKYTILAGRDKLLIRK